ncbi:RloB family protein [Candidatus Poriferisodalis sp.]|uniref:RloB family protein n=1 Tax=Candidatus Poriferisodalis sp. TaxID=3101277 RepID=UPI003AF6A6B9
MELGRGEASPRQILVFTEGEATEKDYVEHWHGKNRKHVRVTVDKFHGSPRRLVEEAIKRRAQDQYEERRGRGRARDEYWCVFDRDSHDDFDQAIATAASNDIRVAYSNPCIELWFILHFRDQTAWIHRHDSQKESKRLLKCEKRLTRQALESLDGSFDDAKHRALQLDGRHQGNDSPPRSNPSSSVWELVERISIR